MLVQYTVLSNTLSTFWEIKTNNKARLKNKRKEINFEQTIGLFTE